VRPEPDIIGKLNQFLFHMFIYPALVLGFEAPWIYLWEWRELLTFGMSGWVGQFGW